MRRTFSLLLPLLLATPLAAEPQRLAVGLSRPQANARWMNSDSRIDVEKVRSFLRSEGWLNLDPELSNADALDVRAQRVGPRTVVRVTPLIEGIRVEGADRILSLGSEAVRAEVQGRLVRRGSFAISPEQATAAAAERVSGNLFTDPTVERLGGFARRVWLAERDGVRAAYRVRVPTLDIRAASDVWVDAQTGTILRRQRIARFQSADAGTPDGGSVDAGVVDAGEMPDSGLADAGVFDAGDPVDAGLDVDAGPTPAAPANARVFVFSPAPGGVSNADLSDVVLPGLRPAQAGGYLRGEFMETYNCCKEYVCLDGSDTCEPELRRCATADDEETIPSTLSLEIPGELLPAPANQLERLYVKTVFCAELPALQSTDEGWYPTPVDQTRAQNNLAGLASEVDAFAEVQAYYTTMQYFAHLRAVLGDPTFCLGGDSMQCDDEGNAALGEDGAPVRPFHISVNFLFPQLDFQGVFGQFTQGKGLSAGNPIEINDFQRLDNAAFIPALEGGPIQVPSELSPLLEVFSRPFDSNLYFQGARDFAYDGDIVAHEFTHALVHSFVPGLQSLSRDEWGAHAEPGAMNEGWSDYFSASFTDDSKTGEYGAVGITGGELGLRDADNTKRCPDDIIGQVHADSETWTGALWDIRKAVQYANPADVAKLDQALLAALAEASNDEDMATQAARVIDVGEEALGASFREVAEEAFAAHNVIDCERVVALTSLDDEGKLVSRPKSQLFVLSPDEIGTANLAPAPVQFRVEVPPASTGFSLRWQQGAGGLGGLTGQQAAPEPLVVLAIEDDRPVTWQYEGNGGRTAQAYDADGELILISPDDPAFQSVTGAANNAGVANGSFDVTFASDPCAAKTFHVQLLGAGASATLQNIEVDITSSDETCDVAPPDAGPSVDPGTPEGCGCRAQGENGGDPTWLVALAGLFVLGRRRRS